MSLNSSMDKVLERRREVEERLSASANMANSELAQLARELSDLRPICDQIELVRRIEAELADALLMAEEAGEDAAEELEEAGGGSAYRKEDDWGKSPAAFTGTEKEEDEAIANGTARPRLEGQD